MVLIRGGKLPLETLDQLRIDDDEARLEWEPGPSGLVSRLFFDPARRTRLRYECSACTTACEHVAGLLSIVLEQKMDLGLAAPPPDVSHGADEAKLVAEAIEERAVRAKKERMKIISSDPSTPWTDYEVRSAISGKTYRVALRSEVRGESYCSCPDFKTNTLGTCKHLIKVLDKAKAFPVAIRNRPYVRRRVTVHLRYQDRDGVALAVALPHRLSEDARAIIEPLTKGQIDVHDLVRRLPRLDAGGHAFFVTPDAEEFIQGQLLAGRLSKLVAEVRSAPAKHPLRRTLLKQELFPYQLDGIAFVAGAGRAILADEMGLGKTIQLHGVLANRTPRERRSAASAADLPCTRMPIALAASSSSELCRRARSPGASQSSAILCSSRGPCDAMVHGSASSAHARESSRAAAREGARPQLAGGGEHACVPYDVKPRTEVHHRIEGASLATTRSQSSARARPGCTAPECSRGERGRRR